MGKFTGIGRESQPGGSLKGKEYLAACPLNRPWRLRTAAVDPIPVKGYIRPAGASRCRPGKPGRLLSQDARTPEDELFSAGSGGPGSLLGAGHRVGRAEVFALRRRQLLPPGGGARHHSRRDRALVQRGAVPAVRALFYQSSTQPRKHRPVLSSRVPAASDSDGPPFRVIRT